ncbi:MAG: hypothetical protein KAI74_01710 [Kiritimatiellae bacterium]|nr:hypothetical protein [Kiritimatiellia bacterium]
MLANKSLFITGLGLIVMSILTHLLIAEEMATPVKNLRLPMEYYEGGAVKTQLKAGFALVPPKGIIIASNVVMEMFFEDGSTNVVMTAESCRYDRAKEMASSAGKVKIVRDDVILTGKGFEWFSDRERVKILSEAKIVLRRKAGKSKGSLLNKFTGGKEKK